MKEVSTGFSQIRNTPGALDSTRVTPKTRSVGDSGFRDQLEALRNTQPSTNTKQNVNSVAHGLKFSNHAIERMQSRGIQFSPEQLAKIESAVAKATAKGAKDTLLLTDQAALIVSIKDKTVVTVMDKTALKENVFTNIDSTVMV